MQKQEFDRLKCKLTYKEQISNIDDYFQASVLALLVLIDNEYHFVFEKRVPHIRQGGEVCFPGGKIDKSDASPLETALRETYEEIGCKAESINILGKLDTLILPNGILVHAYLGILSEPINPQKIAKDEVDSIFTIPLSFFLLNEPEVYSCKVFVHPYLNNNETGEKEILLPVEELGLPDYYSEPWGEAYHNIYVYRTSYELVWGLTAKIVHDCVTKIKKAQK